MRGCVLFAICSQKWYLSRFKVEDDGSIIVVASGMAAANKRRKVDNDDAAGAAGAAVDPEKAGLRWSLWEVGVMQQGCSTSGGPATNSLLLFQDQSLLRQVVQLGTNWQEAAKHIPGRTPRQCSDRYVSGCMKALHVNPCSRYDCGVM